MTQLGLDFAHVPEIPCNPTVNLEQAPQMQRKSWAILARLLRGPATNVELDELIGGLRGAPPRIGEIQRRLRYELGIPSMLLSERPVRGEYLDKARGLYLYSLESWAVEAARGLVAKREAT